MPGTNVIIQPYHQALSVLLPKFLTLFVLNSCLKSLILLSCNLINIRLTISGIVKQRYDSLLYLFDIPINRAITISFRYKVQAKLPDVNAAIVRYRSQALESVKTRDYEMAVSSINFINADLPEEYKVQVSTDLYNSIVEDRKIIPCQFCTSKETVLKDGKLTLTGKSIPTECSLTEIIQYDLEMDWLEQILSGKKSKRVWNCTKCGKLNDMDVSKIKIKKYQAPFYLKIMPEPPKRKRGIQGRASYDNDFKTWFDIAMSEIESQISKYRAEYAAQEAREEIKIIGDN